MLAIRCLEGATSLLVVSGPSNASAGEAVDLKLVADSKGIQEEDAEVIGTTDFTTSVQFGDASTLEYLDGAQKISLRYELGKAISTVSFSGGKSLTVVIAKARKACGLEASDAPKASQQGVTSKAPTTGEGSSSQSCEAQFQQMKKSGDLGSNPDKAGFMVWCSNQSASVGSPLQPNIQSCALFDQIKRDLPDATNSGFEAQHLTGLKVISVDLIGPAAAWGQPPLHIARIA